jgi:hypothetical protein
MFFVLNIEMADMSVLLMVVGLLLKRLRLDFVRSIIIK